MACKLSTWRAEAAAAADEHVTVSCPAEAGERFKGMLGVLAEIHLRHDTWYTFSMTGRDGKAKRIFVEVRKYPAVTA
jgi:hypothetical protein